MGMEELQTELLRLVSLAAYTLEREQAIVPNLKYIVSVIEDKKRQLYVHPQG